MQYALISLLLTLIEFYTWVVIASFVMSWLIAFDVINYHSQAVRTILRVVTALTQPVYEPIQRFIPPIGGLDFTPMIVLITLQFIRNVLVSHAGSFAFG